MKRFRTTIFILSASMVSILFSACTTQQAESTSATGTGAGTEAFSTADIPSGNLFSYESNYDKSQPIYVIGHLAPDSDTVCSSIAFADLLEQLGYRAVPAVSGTPNSESAFILEKYGIATPQIINDASDKQFFLVDHSSFLQSISNMDKSDIIGVVDHHNIGNIETNDPIVYLAMPVGCTSTIVYQLYNLYNVPITKQMAGMMLSAILSDTTGLKSVTTTEYDKAAVTALMPLAGVDDYEAYTEEMLKAGNNYDSMTTEEILYSDLKYMEAGNTKYAIAFVQSTDADQLKKIEKQLNQYMQDKFDSIGASPVYVMMVNQKTAQTKLLCYGDNALKIAQEAFGITDDEIILENTLSRKKQVNPPLKEIIQNYN